MTGARTIYSPHGTLYWGTSPVGFHELRSLNISQGIYYTPSRSIYPVDGPDHLNNSALRFHGSASDWIFFGHGHKERVSIYDLLNSESCVLWPGSQACIYRGVSLGIHFRSNSVCCLCFYSLSHLSFPFFYGMQTEIQPTNNSCEWN